MGEQCLQERYAPENRCFGCGPKNERGLRIRSFVSGEAVVAEFDPEPWQEAFTGMLSGGIAGTLLDCHMNWTAAWRIMNERGEDAPPCTVTAEFTVKLKRPTPTDRRLRLVARVVEASGDRATVEATLCAGDVVTATGRGVFVAVKPGHPAYHRW